MGDQILLCSQPSALITIQWPSDVKRWRNAPDPQGPSASEPRNVAPPRSGGGPKKQLWEQRNYQFRCVFTREPARSCPLQFTRPWHVFLPD
jgi:hypothetical protein